MFPPAWSVCRRIGGSPLVRATAAVPAIGYFVVLSSRLDDGLSNVFGIGIAVARQSLISIYFGLCAVAIGAILFALRCPTVIRRYADEGDMLHAELPIMTLARTETLLLSSGRWSSKAMRIGIEKEVSCLREFVVRGGSDVDIRRSYINTLSCFYLGEDGSLFFSRLMFCVLICIGAVLIYIPTLRTLKDVVAMFLFGGV